MRSRSTPGELPLRRAGNPSYRRLQRLTGLSPSTISRIFNARKPPKWENLARLLLALGVQRDEQHAVWHPLWAGAVDRVDPLDDMPDISQEKQNLGCGRCGAVVVDGKLHDEFHTRLSRSEESLTMLERRTRRLARMAMPTGPIHPAPTGQHLLRPDAGPSAAATADRPPRGGEYSS